MFKPRFWISIVAVVGVVIAVGWYLSRTVAPSSNSLKLVFKAQAKAAPLIYDEYLYKNPGGDGDFRVRNFRFFLSNVELHNDHNTFAESDSYHLIRFDDPGQPFVVQLDNVPLNEIDHVTLSIGVDDLANKSIEARGDLDPNSGMAWNWEVGYKFVVFEGSISLEDQVLPLVYHVGFAENRRDIKFQLPTILPLSDTPEIRFSVDVMKLFDGTNKIDLAALQTVKFDKTDAAMMADNYEHMISISGH